MAESSTTDPAGAPRRSVLIYACSGASNVAEIADRVARKLMAEGKGRMYCLAGLGADNPGMVQTARDADLNLVIDGCPMDCARKIFARHRLTNIRVVRITDHGIAKSAGTPATGEQIEAMGAHAVEVIGGESLS